MPKSTMLHGVVVWIFLCGQGRAGRSTSGAAVLGPPIFDLAIGASTPRNEHRCLPWVSRGRGDYPCPYIASMDGRAGSRAAMDGRLEAFSSRSKGKGYVRKRSKLATGPNRLRGKKKPINLA
jgi:hypothetical protein